MDREHAFLESCLLLPAFSTGGKPGDLLGLTFAIALMPRNQAAGKPWVISTDSWQEDSIRLTMLKHNARANE